MKIYLGAIGTDSNKKFLENIIEEKKLYDKQYVLVPENISYYYEEKLLENGSNMQVEIITFNRLQYLLFKNTKYNNISYVDDILRKMYIKKAISNLDITLLKKDKNISEIDKMIVRLKEQGIKSDELKQKITNNENIHGILKIKLEELIQIIEEYDKLLEDKKDKAEELSIVLDAIKESNVFEDAKLYITGFTNFTLMQFKVLEEIIRKCKDVDVEITIDDLGSKNSIFKEASTTLNNIIGYMSAKGNISFEKFEEDNYHKSMLGKLNNALASKDIIYIESNCNEDGNSIEKNSDEEEKQIQLMYYPSKKEEIARLANNIYNDMKKGISANDIQVIANDSSKYYNYIQTEFAKYGIHINIGENRSIVADQIITYILNLLNAILGKVDSIIALAKMGYFKEYDISLNDIYILENYMKKWDIQDLSRYGKLRYEKDRPDFDTIVTTKSKLLKILTDAIQNIVEETSENTNIVEEELDEEKIYKTFNSYSEKIKKIMVSSEAVTKEIVMHLKKNNIYAKIYNEILKLDDLKKITEYKNSLNILNEVLDKMSQIGEITIYDYASYLEEVLKENTQRETPVKNAVDFRTSNNIFKDKKITYVMSVQDGVFPKETTVSGLIDEDENIVLRASDINIYNTLEEDETKNYMQIYNTLMAASDKVVLSYTNNDDFTEEEIVPSYYISRIEKILKNNDISYTKSSKEDYATGDKNNCYIPYKDEGYIVKIITELEKEILETEKYNIVYEYILENVPNTKKAMLDLTIYLAKKITRYNMIIKNSVEYKNKIDRLLEIYDSFEIVENGNDDSVSVSENGNGNEIDSTELEYEKRKLEIELFEEEIERENFKKKIQNRKYNILEYYMNMAKIYAEINNEIIYNFGFEKVYIAAEKENNPNNLPKDILNKLYKNDLSMTISRLEKYARCPFAYHIRYMLSVEKARTSKLESLDTGSFIHDVIKKVFDKVQKGKLKLKGKLEDEALLKLKLRAIEDSKLKKDIALYENDIAKVVDDAILDTLKETRYEKILSNSKSKKISENLKREICNACIQIAETLRLSEYDIYGNEIEIGIHESPNSLDNVKIEFDVEGDKKAINIFGKVDRADILEDNIRIIDYKTSKNDIDTNKVRAGLQLQLIIYASALEELLEKENKGLLYQQITTRDMKISYINEDNMYETAYKNKYQKMQGLIVSDGIEELYNMDKTLENTNNSNIIPVRLKKDGTPDRFSKVIANNDYKELKEDAKNAVIDLSKNILKGNVDIYPSKYYVTPKVQEKACRFCDYESICKFGKQNKYRIINKNNE